MNKTLNAIILILIVPSGFCQELTFRMGVGYNNTSPTELIEFNKDYSENFMVPLTLTDNFPQRPQLDGEVRLFYEKFYGGIFYRQFSTGSRLYYSDYSGLYRFDMICSIHQFGPTAGIVWFENEKLQSLFTIKIPAIQTAVRLIEEIQIYNESVEEETNLVSGSIGLEPGLELNYKLSVVSIGLNVSYLLNARGYLHERNNIEHILMDVDGEKVYTDWKGAYAGISIGVNITQLFELFTVPQ